MDNGGMVKHATGICPNCYEDEEDAAEIEDGWYECYHCRHIYTHMQAVDALSDYADSMRDWIADSKLESMV
jgi:hypothetical protein